MIIMKQNRSIRNRKTITLTKIAVSVVFLVVSGWVAIPWILPFTLQTLTVFLVIGLLGAAYSSVAIMVYLLLGIIGLPVFSGFQSGIGALIGPTGGFLLGFLLCAPISGWLVQRFAFRFQGVFLSYLLGLTVCYGFGLSWYVLVYQRQSAQSWGAAAMCCVVPFLLPDLIKLFFATILTKRLRGILNQIGY